MINDPSLCGAVRHTHALGEPARWSSFWLRRLFPLGAARARDSRVGVSVFDSRRHRRRRIIAKLKVPDSGEQLSRQLAGPVTDPVVQTVR
jgi:hypothetical protein